ncbi:hypothetical protein CCMSSC00406_0007004 [Pleurotus cornucopiae]|uniref:Uncharacterized protein n=1 Tax=Pleurotus cornucopiae TaxID=5321 RepID=A0ACB7IZ13_PLECO|nr:hypothetical protein CCMSSC00406_0007004 [Pleurotus cornucopiae]
MARTAHLASAKHRQPKDTAIPAAASNRSHDHREFILDQGSKSPPRSTTSSHISFTTTSSRDRPKPDLRPSLSVPDPCTSTGCDQPADHVSATPANQLTDNSSLAEMSARVFVETLRSPSVGVQENTIWQAPLQSVEADDGNDDISALLSSFSQLNIGSPSLQLPASMPLSGHVPPASSDVSSAEETPNIPSPPSRTAQRDPGTNHLVTRHLHFIGNIEMQAEECWKSLPISGSISPGLLSGVDMRCTQLLTDLDKLKHKHPEVQRQRLKVATKLHNIEARIADLRNAAERRAISPTIICTDRHYSHPIEKLNPIAQKAILIGLVCSFFMGTSRRAGDFIMKSLSSLVTTVYEATGQSTPQTVLNQIPATITHALSQFNLESRTTIYAVCPKCCFTHPPKFHHNSTIATYPSLCTHKETSASENCGEPLLTTRTNANGSDKPIKPFVYHHFSDYMAGLLSSKKDEEAMDRACDDAFASADEPPPERITNIFQGSFIRSFLGPDGRKLFIDRGGEGRFLHSLNIDFFDAEGMTVRGATGSWGLFSTACLNLPESEMHKPEKMYFNIIPGPHEPDVNQLNHFMRPFVDEMCTSWTRGVYYTRTALCPEGRISRDAVACVVCDLLGARKAAGLPYPRSHAYCSVCQCFKQATLGRFDPENWVEHDVEQMHKFAESYRDAPTIDARQKLFDKFKVRWSELWRLPYWNPVRQLVVDVMHAVYENWAEFFYRDTLKLTSAKAKAKLKCIPAFKLTFQMPTKAQTERFAIDATSRDQMRLIGLALTMPFVLDSVPDPIFVSRLSILDEGTLFMRPESLKLRLMTYKLPALRFAVSCVKPGLELPNVKADCVTVLINWRTTQTLAPDESFFEKRIATPETMAHIRSVIENTTMPSWFDKPPKAFGDAATGTLKADEWRSMSSIYLPLALVTLWGEGSQMASHPDAEYYQHILNLTMLLASAMFLISRRTTSAEIAESYRRCIKDWTKLFYEVLPTAALRPNLHMAFHVYDFLLLFGPPKSWWTFPFESLIGLIQRTKSNHKQGEMESTLVDSFIQAGVLRRWLSKDDCPKPIHEFKALFDKVFTPRRRNEAEEHAMGINAAKQTTACKTPPDLFAVIKTPRVVLRAYAGHKGTILARASTHVGSSLVSFYPGGDASVNPVPGSIQYIIEGETCCQLAIRRHKSSPTSVADPFRHWPHVPISLYSAALEPELEIVELDWVVGHVGRYPYSADLVAIIRVHRRD